jgi:hypothetical protein
LVVRPSKSTLAVGVADLVFWRTGSITLPGSRDGTITRHGPLFDWFLDRFAYLDWTIPAGSLSGLPPTDMRPRQLERFLLEDADYAQRDRIWAAVIAGAREPATAEPYRVLAIGLAARGLRGFRLSRTGLSLDEYADVDHDLVLGFLRRLGTIDVRTSNLGMKLIDSGITYARTRQSQPRPASVELQPISAIAGDPEDDVSALLNESIAELAKAEKPLADQDVKLLTLTIVDGFSVKDAAKNLGLNVQVAYKRRQRAGARLRDHLAAAHQPSGEVPAPGGSATGRGATASAEAAAPPTR